MGLICSPLTAPISRANWYTNKVLKALEEKKVFPCCGTCVYGKGTGYAFERDCVKTSEKPSRGNPIFHWCGDHEYGDYEDFMNRPTKGKDAPPDGA